MGFLSLCYFSVAQEEKEVERRSARLTLALKQRSSLVGRDPREPAEVVTAVRAFTLTSLCDNRRFRFAPHRLIKCHDSLFKCVEAAGLAAPRSRKPTGDVSLSGL